jgi:hypothetical protein
MNFIYQFNEYISNINEGLIKTYDIDKTIGDLKSTISELNIKFNLSKINETKIELIIDDFDKIDKIDLKLELIISNFFNLYGWFPSTMEIENFYGMLRKLKFRKETLLQPNNLIIKVKIEFESKFDKIENDIPKKLYHLSIKQYEKSILQNGIIPKSKSKISTHDYDGRIYLCKSKLGCKTLINKMKLFYSYEKDQIIYDIRNTNKKYNKDTKWILFEIDTDMADIKTLYKDPNYIDGFYYLEIIPKDSILISEIE